MDNVAKSSQLPKIQARTSQAFYVRFRFALGSCILYITKTVPRQVKITKEQEKEEATLRAASPDLFLSADKGVGDISYSQRTLDPACAKRHLPSCPEGARAVVSSAGSGTEVSRWPKPCRKTQVPWRSPCTDEPYRIRISSASEKADRFRIHEGRMRSCQRQLG